jgi:hypothetical protein
MFYIQMYLPISGWVQSQTYRELYTENEADSILYDERQLGTTRRKVML